MNLQGGTKRAVTLDRQLFPPERNEGGFKPGSAIDDDEFRSLQATRIEIGEEPTPCRLAFAAHVLDGEQHLLPVAAHADRCQYRDVRGLAVQPGLDNGAVQDQTDDVIIGEAARAPRVPVDLHLAPGPADDVLADRPLKQAEQRFHLFEIVEERYRRKSTIVTAQTPVAKWHDLIADPTVADAILDRLVHNAHRIELKGESMRKQKNAPS